MSLKYKDDEGATHNFGAFTTNIENTFDGTSENAMSGVAIQSVLDKKQDHLQAGTYIKIVKAGAIEKSIETSVYPITFKADGSDLINYTIQGNLSYTGTAMIDSPIDVLGVGSEFNIVNNGVETSLYLSYPLYKIGDSVDVLDYKTRQIKRCIKKVNLLNLTWESGGTASGCYRFKASVPDYIPNVESGRANNVYFNRFHYLKNGDEYGLGFGHSTKIFYIYVSDEVKTVAQLQQWLTENETYAVYPCAEFIESAEDLLPVATIEGDNSLSVSADVAPNKISINYIQKYEGEDNGYIISVDGIEALINRLIDERLNG